MEEIILTKQVAKHGKQSIIILPKFLQSHIQARDVVQVKIKLVKKGEPK